MRDIAFAKEEREQKQAYDMMNKQHAANDAAIRGLVSIFGDPNNPLGKMKKSNEEIYGHDRLSCRGRDGRSLQLTGGTSHDERPAHEHSIRF